ncbi:hypothetical protein NX773_11625 [Massilia solisilvae]|uniref:Uncharacterized protein n=1 Tax=Massilia solisilvae TaxID=1811225 RepID=A0ABT2BJX6_9BURK|nr:hypothetical protein [Massilia solisilvae]MCS0608816.1 hypothetical protein [Massilia solisilvae]
MYEPKLTIALAQRGEQPVLLISRNDNAVFNSINWELALLADMGYLGACAHVGKAALRMLELAHPRVFDACPDLKSPDEPDASDVLRYLLHQSFLEHTRAYVPAIDSLLKRHRDTIDSSTREHWPETRDHILRQFTD